MFKLKNKKEKELNTDMVEKNESGLPETPENSVVNTTEAANAEPAETAETEGVSQAETEATEAAATVAATAEPVADTAAPAEDTAVPIEDTTAPAEGTAEPEQNKDKKTGKKNKKKSKKRKKKIGKVIAGIVIALGVIGLAFAAVAFMRTKLLDTQLDMAKSYMEAEEWDKAEDAYNQALKIFHNSADAYLGLAEVSIGRGELTEAIKILEDGIAKTGSANLEKSRDVIMDQVFATYVLDSYLVNILPGETAKLTVEHRSEDMDFKVKWSSADETIGTVDEDGNIEALKEGTTKIVANIGNETWGYRDVSATLIVGVVVTYLEEQGCDYVSSATGLMAPCFVYQQTEDGFRKYDGTLEIEQGNATYSLSKCKVSDPDPDGYVTYDIEYTVNVPTKFGILANSTESKHKWYYNWMAEEMFLCDDYTGQIFSVQDLYGEEGLIYDSTVTWNDMDYHITGTTESEWVNEEEWAVTYSPLTTITWAEAPVIGTFKLQVKVPAEYEGLVLALDKKGVTDYTDPETDETDEYDAAETFTDTFFFDPLEDGSVRKPQEFYIVRLKDFAQKKQ
ncbi:MAG: Ig-like domain-containing protein [Lachnospiraceae bacterium]|nr:Ig-like domain-containing protein [Lachnospiraceae bacterium]